VAAVPSSEMIYVEKYEAIQHDDGASWIHMVAGWEGGQAVDGRTAVQGKQLVGILPLKFSADLKESARDFAWLLNKARTDRLAQGHYVPLT